ncbi:MAG: tetratricopeptide repeat protein [Euryarchaeota archaeon]|nr:tetratricopeptide repeat protein [Euryarchaeota archaeon]
MMTGFQGLHSKFVDRSRELAMLNEVAKDVFDGRGRVVLVEGFAGVGKTALIEQFMENMRSKFTVLRGTATADIRYVPYGIFSQIFREYGSMEEIRLSERRRYIESLARRLLEEPKMLFVDESGDAAFYLYRVMSGHAEGLHISPFPRDNVIWLTELSTTRPGARPSQLDFSVIPEIQDNVKQNTKLIFVENLNYLLLYNSASQVLEFLYSLKQMYPDRIIIIAGRSELMTGEERDTLLAPFDEVIHLEWETMQRPGALISVKNRKEGVVFSTRPGAGKYTVGPGYLEPQRMEFELSDRMTMELDAGNDVVVDCAAMLIRAHGLRKFAAWIKNMGDYAHTRGRKVYLVVESLGTLQRNYLSYISSASEMTEKVIYEDMERVESIRLYDAILSFLKNRASKLPILLVVENVHRIDRSSLSLLEYIAANSENARIMTVITYRNEDIVSYPEALETVKQLRRLEHALSMRLKSLSMNALKQMFPDFDESRVEIIYRKSEGNPLLALTIARRMIENEEVPASSSSSGLSEEYIPDSIRESVLLMVDSLDDDVLYFLRFFAVCGESVSEEILKTLYPDYKAYLPRLMGTILTRENGVIRFVYSTYRDVIYSTIARDTRDLMHLKIAAVLESLGMHDDAAHHYYMARDKRSIPLLMSSAQRAMDIFAVANAVEFYEKALEIARKHRDHERVQELLEKLGDAYRIMGKYARAIEMYEELLALTSGREVEIATKIVSCHTRLGNYDEALLILNEHMKRSDGLLRGRMLGQRGMISLNRGEFDDALRDFKEYLSIAESENSVQDIATALRNYGFTYYYMGDYQRCVELVKKAVSLSSEIGDYDGVATGYAILGLAQDKMHNLDGAMEYYRKYLEMARKMGNMNYVAKAYNNMAFVFIRKGKFEKARYFQMKSLEYDLKLGNKRDISISYYNLAEIEASSGDYLKALEYMRKSTEYAEKIDDRYDVCTNHIRTAELMMDMRDYESAIKYAELAMDISRSMGYEGEQLRAELIIARALAHKGAVEEGMKHLKHVEAAQDMTGDLELRYEYVIAAVDIALVSGNIDWAESVLDENIDALATLSDEKRITLFLLRAKLRCRRGDVQNAIRYFDELLGELNAGERKKLLADTLIEFGKCLLSVNKEEAEEHLKRALEIYRKMALNSMAEEVMKLLK